MVGVKERSGGRRKGSGRPPKVISIGRKFKLRAGESVQVSYTEKDGTRQEYFAILLLERAPWGYRLVLEAEAGWRATIGTLSKHI